MEVEVKKAEDENEKKCEVKDERRSETAGLNVGGVRK